MKEKNCKYLTPFKMCIIDNFPFIEEDFDAITNYQLLCKVVEYLNKVIASENEQNKAIKEIQDYLTNLDLQDEVDKKLDEMVESGELQEIIASYLNAKAIFGFDNVESMKNATNLIEGSYAETLGYYAKNDGGKSLYKVRQITNDDVVDESFIIALYNDNLVAELIYKNELNVDQLGLYGDRTHDDSDKLNDILSKIPCGVTLNFSVNKEYKLTKPIYIPRFVNLDGKSCNLIISGNTLNNTNYVFNYPSDRLTPENQISHLNYDTFIKNFQVINGESDTKNFITVNSELNISNIYTWGFNKTVNLSSSYIDFITITDINSFNKRGTDYIIEAGFLGDGIKISRIHLYQQDVDATSRKNLHILGGHNAILVDTIVNGDITIENSNVNISNIHLESGHVYITNGSVNIDNGYIVKRVGAYPIEIKGLNTFVKLSNIMVSYQTSAVDYTEDNGIDIACDINTHVTIENCYKNLTNSNDINFKSLSGLTSTDADFNKNIVANSLSSVKVSDTYESQVKAQLRPNNSYNILENFYVTNNTTWLKPSGTYYYKPVVMFDSVRLAGSILGSNEKSLALTNNAGGANTSIGYKPSANLRLYRGTSTGSYSEYADIGVLGNYITDNGYLVNGCKWNSREEGDVDSINPCLSYEYIDVWHRNVKVYAYDIPSYGTWTKGDIIINANFNSGTPYGWICTTAGTPGTWKVISTIA